MWPSEGGSQSFCTERLMRLCHCSLSVAHYCRFCSLRFLLWSLLDDLTSPQVLLQRLSCNKGITHSAKKKDFYLL